MTLAFVEEVAGLLILATMVAILGTCVVVTLRLRRRWRRRNGLVGVVFSSLGHLPAASLTAGAVSTVASPAWWMVQRDRHAMRRSVVGARRAVSVAVRAKAPVGDLPSLVRQLQQAADDVDAALQASGGHRRLARDANTDRLRIEAAAADIRAAAISSLDAMRVGVQPLVSAIAVEADALAAGVSVARGAAPVR
jgi:hypothetical protein